ncbi:Podospora anserina S mat genomic DNA chromosome 3, supercontig 2 [Lecanosticta acicola]|uniref:Podospora anserina S mat genomic DNA chromosome 3, supercontig 2 n=1 Tax=Lecanosticta acicola TaxID=111012 RepID=A0AAI8Z742_9PEZI|nr:Podospora anserina S mat genomic DNA chromosome 3, supercontig 2 [Lecanosticta acicola]
MRPTQLLRSGGGKIPYPKHVWSPAGGWYAQPHNWKTNTAIMGAVLTGIVAMVFSYSAEVEYRNEMPRPDRFFPSRYWSKQIREHEREQREKATATEAES